MCDGGGGECVMVVVVVVVVSSIHLYYHYSHAYGNHDIGQKCYFIIVQFIPLTSFTVF